LPIQLDTGRIIRIFIQRDEGGTPQAYVVYTVENAAGRRLERKTIPFAVTPAMKTALVDAATAAYNAAEGL
jgi:hypothetical protein